MIFKSALFVVLIASAACTRTPSSSSAAPSQKEVTTSGSPSSDEPALKEIADFDRPSFVTAPSRDNRLFVTELGGRIFVVEDGRKIETPFLDISSSVGSGGERGLFSMAFAPDYRQTGLAYVSYTDTNGDSNVVEYKISSDPNRLDVSSARRVLFQPQPFSNHNGGLILFDSYGKLIVSFGDGGSANDPGNRAQDLQTMLGKLVRIDPRHPSRGKPYGIPSDNPALKGALPEIWAYGLRNPWRFSFDPASRTTRCLHNCDEDLYLADVGQNAWEEIDRVKGDMQAGANYGWRVFEGNEQRTNEPIDNKNLVRPIFTYPTHSEGRCAIVGGYVYRGQVQSLRGYYLYTDNCNGLIRGFKVVHDKVVDQRTFDQMTTNIPSSFGEDSKGDLYIADLAGKVYEVVPSS